MPIAWAAGSTLWLHLLICGVLMGAMGAIARRIVVKRWGVIVTSKEFILIAALVIFLLIFTRMASDLLLACVYSSLYVVGYFVIKVVRHLNPRKDR